MLNDAAIEDVQLSFADVDEAWSAAMKALLSEDDPSRNQSLDKGKRRQVSPFTSPPEVRAEDFYERRIAALKDFLQGYNGDKRIVTNIDDRVCVMRKQELNHCIRELENIRGAE